MKDDAYIIHVGRTLMKRGGSIQFAEAEEVEDGFKVAVSLSAAITVPLQGDIAHGRRMALEIITEWPDGR